MNFQASNIESLKKEKIDIIFLKTYEFILISMNLFLSS